MDYVDATPGPLVAVKGTEDEPDRWLVVSDGPTQFHVATIENGQPGDALKPFAGLLEEPEDKDEMIEVWVSRRDVLLAQEALEKAGVSV